MKFFDYCATQYASINHQMQLENPNFDLKKQAKTKAAHELIDAQRKWFKFVAKVSFVFDFFLLISVFLLILTVISNREISTIFLKLQFFYVALNQSNNNIYTIYIFKDKLFVYILLLALFGLL